MSFFKPLTEVAANKTVARLHTLIWVLIYGGLLTLVLGLTVQRSDDALGWSMLVGGGLVAAAGFALIYLRSKMKVEP